LKLTSHWRRSYRYAKSPIRACLKTFGDQTGAHRTAPGTPSFESCVVRLLSLISIKDSPIGLPSTSPNKPNDWVEVLRRSDLRQLHFNVCCVFFCLAGS
jgi:hypothetical protein